MEIPFRLGDVLTNCWAQRKFPHAHWYNNKIVVGQTNFLLGTDTKISNQPAIRTFEKLDKIYLNTQVQAPDKIENTQ